MMSTEIKLKDKGNEGTNFILWIIFLCLLGSGMIFISYEKRVGLILFGSAFVFWMFVRVLSKRKNRTIKL